MKAVILNKSGKPAENATKRNNPRSSAKNNGVFNFTWKALKFVLRKTLGLHWQNNIFFERPLNEPVPGIVPKIKVQIRKAIIDDHVKFKGMFNENKYKRLRERFTKGRLCFVAIDGEKVVGQQWVSLDDEYDPELKIGVKVNNNEGYLYDVYVVPEYRSNRLQLVLAAEAMKYLHDQGYEKATTIVAAYNTHSLRTCATEGFIPKRTVFYFTIFGLKFHSWGKYTGKL
jgi:GNAT superfamily N-acetyltransferase